MQQSDLIGIVILHVNQLDVDSRHIKRTVRQGDFDRIQGGCGRIVIPPVERFGDAVFRRHRDLAGCGIDRDDIPGTACRDTTADTDIVPVCDQDVEACPARVVDTYPERDDTVLIRGNKSVDCGKFRIAPRAGIADDEGVIREMHGNAGADSIEVHNAPIGIQPSDVAEFSCVSVAEVIGWFRVGILCRRPLDDLFLGEFVAFFVKVCDRAEFGYLGIDRRHGGIGVYCEGDRVCRIRCKDLFAGDTAVGSEHSDLLVGGTCLHGKPAVQFALRNINTEFICRVPGCRTVNDKRSLTRIFRGAVRRKRLDHHHENDIAVFVARHIRVHLADCVVGNHPVHGFVVCHVFTDDHIILIVHVHILRNAGEGGNHHAAVFGHPVFNVRVEIAVQNVPALRIRRDGAVFRVGTVFDRLGRRTAVSVVSHGVGVDLNAADRDNDVTDRVFCRYRETVILVECHRLRLAVTDRIGHNDLPVRLRVRGTQHDIDDLTLTILVLIPLICDRAGDIAVVVHIEVRQYHRQHQCVGLGRTVLRRNGDNEFVFTLGESADLLVQRIGGDIARQPDDHVRRILTDGDRIGLALRIVIGGHAVHRDGVDRLDAALGAVDNNGILRLLVTDGYRDGKPILANNEVLFLARTRNGRGTVVRDGGEGHLRHVVTDVIGIGSARCRQHIVTGFDFRQGKVSGFTGHFDRIFLFGFIIQLHNNRECVFPDTHGFIAVAFHGYIRLCRRRRQMNLGNGVGNRVGIHAVRPRRQHLVADPDLCQRQDRCLTCDLNRVRPALAAVLHGERHFIFTHVQRFFAGTLDRRPAVRRRRGDRDFVGFVPDGRHVLAAGRREELVTESDLREGHIGGRFRRRTRHLDSQFGLGIVRRKRQSKLVDALFQVECARSLDFTDGRGCLHDCFGDVVGKRHGIDCPVRLDFLAVYLDGDLRLLRLTARHAQHGDQYDNQQNGNQLIAFHRISS